MVGLSAVRAEEDEVDEEDDGTVEEEGGETVEPDVEESTTTSPDADTTLLFTKPSGTTNMGRYIDRFMYRYIVHIWRLIELLPPLNLVELLTWVGRSMDLDLFM